MRGKDSHLTRQIDERQTHHAKLANTGKHLPGAPTCGNARGYKEPAPQQLSPRCAKKAWTTCAVTFCRAVLLPHAGNRWAAPPNGPFLSLVRLNPAYAVDGSWWCRGQERGALSTLPCWLASLGFACNLENAFHLLYHREPCLGYVCSAGRERGLVIPAPFVPRHSMRRHPAPPG